MILAALIIASLAFVLAAYAVYHAACARDDARDALEYFRIIQEMVRNQRNQVGDLATSAPSLSASKTGVNPVHVGENAGDHLAQAPPALTMRDYARTFHRDGPYRSAGKVLTALLLALLAVGCSSLSPAKSLTLQGESVALVLNLAADARDMGYISQAELDSARPAVDAYLAARARAEKQMLAGADPSSVQSLIEQANAAWAKAAPFIQSLIARKARATTKPGG